MGELTGYIPEWVKPTRQEIVDCTWIAHAHAEQAGPRSRAAQVLAVMDWVTTQLPTEDQAYDRMMVDVVSPTGDTLAWLLGMVGPIAPILLPRRNPDGSLFTRQQFYDEYMAERWNGPEERLAAERHASEQAIRSGHLAALVPH